MTANTKTQVGDTRKDEVNGHLIIVSVGIDCYTINVFLGAIRLDDWAGNYAGHTVESLNAALTEARRIRDLVLTHGSLANVDREAQHLALQAEAIRRRNHYRPTGEAARRISNIDEEMDRLMPTRHVIMNARLHEDLGAFLAGEVEPKVQPEAAEPVEPAAVPALPQPRPGHITIAPKRRHRIVANHKLSPAQVRAIQVAMAGDGTLQRGRGPGKISITTIYALEVRGYAQLTGDTNGARPTGCRITPAGVAAANWARGNA